MPQSNEQIYNAYIEHQVKVQRYSKSQIRKMLNQLDKVEKDIVAKLAQLNPDWKQKQLEAFLKEVRDLYKALYKDLTGTLEADLKLFGESELDFHSEMLDKASLSARINVSIQKPTIEQVYAAANARPMSLKVGMAAPLRDWINGLQEGAAKRVEQTIRLGFVEGESVPSIIKRVRNDVLPISRRGAEMLVRTSVNHFSNVARSEVFKANADILTGEMWNAILDGRTSLICRDLDGKVFKVGEGKRPPAHPNCRSYMTPVLKGIEPPSRTSYAEWFKRQSASRQDEILGSAKGKLYRDGKLPLSAFSDNGKELTLKQLKEEYSLIFKAVGL